MGLRAKTNPDIATERLFVPPPANTRGFCDSRANINFFAIHPNAKRNRTKNPVRFDYAAMNSGMGGVGGKCESRRLRR